MCTFMVYDNKMITLMKMMMMFFIERKIARNFYYNFIVMNFVSVGIHSFSFTLSRDIMKILRGQREWHEIATSLLYLK